MMHADTREVFVYGFILKFRAVIRQKYLGGAESQVHSVLELLQDGPRICFADGDALN